MIGGWSSQLMSYKQLQKYEKLEPVEGKPNIYAPTNKDGLLEICSHND